MPLSDRLKAKIKTTPKTSKPLWDGPESDSAMGGITFSLLSRVLVCKERARLLLVDGIKAADDFNPRIEYGNMWHVCEEALAKDSPWAIKLKTYCQELVKKYQPQQEQVQHWYKVCQAQFPHYVDWWAKHEDVKARTPVYQEKVFKVPYELQSGRTVYLRGKFDSVDIIGKGKDRGVYLQENKTKSDIDQPSLMCQLTFDLQTMMYLVALGCYDGADWDQAIPIRGVRYNVIRRPLGGGRNSIRQHKPSKSNPSGESAEEFYNRLSDLIKNEIEPDKTHYYFMRWKSDVSKKDINKFVTTCFDPILENLCDDYEWWAFCKKEGIKAFDDVGSRFNRALNFPQHCPRHFRFPYGVWNPLMEGYSSDLDEHLHTGSMVGLQYLKDGSELFRELN